MTTGPRSKPEAQWTDYLLVGARANSLLPAARHAAPPMHPLTVSSTALLRLIKSLTPAEIRAHLSASAIHCLLFKEGLLHAGAHLPTTLLSAYAVLGRPRDARKLFDEMPEPCLVARTAMARAHVASGQEAQALSVFKDMLADGVLPDNRALSIALTACHGMGSSSAARKPGKMVHAVIVTSGIVPDVFVSTELIRLYGECGDMSASRKVFDEMPVRSNFSWNAMMHQYFRHGNSSAAHDLFLAMPRRDVVSWNTVIAGYCLAGRCREALGLFRQMVSPSCTVRPNGPTLNTVLSACADAGGLETGIWVHAYIDKNHMNDDGSLDRCLIDMYAKCGSIDKALQIFEMAPPGKRHLFSWTTVICGLAMHGRAADALRMFDMMQDNGIHPDVVTLVGVLNACAHGGLVDEGLRYFHSMEKRYSIAPKIEHYGCIIDLLGRVGRLQEAYNMIRTMPMKPNAVIWGALLSACKVHNNVELGEIAAAEVSKLEPGDPWARVMLSSMYARAQDWSSLARERREINILQMKKMPGCSSIELDGKVHEFVAGGFQHPQLDEIFDALENIEAHAYAG